MSADVNKMRTDWNGNVIPVGAVMRTEDFTAGTILKSPIEITSTITNLKPPKFIDKSDATQEIEGGMSAVELIIKVHSKNTFNASNGVRWSFWDPTVEDNYFLIQEGETLVLNLADKEVKDIYFKSHNTNIVEMSFAFNMI